MPDRMTGEPGQALLAPSDIAKLGGVSAAAVSNWRKRSADFPVPAGGSPARPLFARDDVVAWMNANDKPVSGLATSNVVAAMNLVSELDVRDGSISIAAEFVVSLVVARKLIDAVGQSSARIWNDVTNAVSVDGISALRSVGKDHRIDRWDELVVLPTAGDDFAPSAMAQVMHLLADLPRNEMAEAADAAIARSLGALGRAGSEVGYVDSQLSKFLVQISAPDARGVVYDPACGIGDVLTQLCATVGWPPIRRVIGHDINERAVVLAKQRGFLRDIELECEVIDVLASDPAPDLKADLVVLEPPFGLRYDAFDLHDRRWAFGVPAKSSSEVAWLQHAIAHLADDGIAYVATSGSAVSNLASEKVRQELVEAGCVHAIYQLPPRLLQHTSLSATIWVLGRPGTSSAIRFVDAEAFGVSERGRLQLPPFTGRDEFESLNPRADVAIRDVLAGGAILAPARWIGLDTSDPNAVADDYAESLAQIRSASRAVGDADPRQFRPANPGRMMTIRELESIGVLTVLRGGMRSRATDGDPRRVSIRDVVERNVGPVTGEAMPDKSRDESPSGDEARLRGVARPGDVTCPGDVLVATSGAAGAARGALAATVDEYGGHVLGADVVGLRVNENQFRVDYLAAVIEGAWNKRLVIGSAIQRVRVQELEIPMLLLEDQVAFVHAAADLRRVQELAERLATAAADAVGRLSEVARCGTIQSSTGR